MTVSFDALAATPRLLIEANLVPVQGARFQPTGFADLGPAEFTRPSDGTQMLLVESAQSVANRLESAILGADGVSPMEELEGLPYVRVRLTGQGKGVTTSSLVEAHRLNSPFISSNKKFESRFLESSGYRKGKVIQWNKVAEAIFSMDPCSLIHGVFFSNLEDGRLRLPRALTGFVEAEGVERAASGGVKNNHFDPAGEIRAEGYDKDVYGNVPYSRVEFTAQRITAYFNLDMTQVRSYGLPDAATRLLIGLSLLKVQRFFDHGLRLRTACDFRLDAEPRATQPEGWALPTTSAVLTAVRAAIKECRKSKLLDENPMELETVTKKKTKKDAKKAPADSDS